MLGANVISSQAQDNVQKAYAETCPNAVSALEMLRSKMLLESVHDAFPNRNKFTVKIRILHQNKIRL